MIWYHIGDTVEEPCLHSYLLLIFQNEQEAQSTYVSVVSVFK